MKNNKTICECTNRFLPCHENLNFDAKDNCENEIDLEKDYQSNFLTTTNGN